MSFAGGEEHHPARHHYVTVTVTRASQQSSEYVRVYPFTVVVLGYMTEMKRGDCDFLHFENRIHLSNRNQEFANQFILYFVNINMAY